MLPFPPGKKIGRIGKGRHPAAILQACIPADMIDVQVGAKDKIHVFERNTQGIEVFDIGGALLMPVAEIGPVFMVADTGIDQNDVLRSADNKGVQAHHQQVRFRVKESRGKPGAMCVNNGLVQVGQEHLRRV